MPKSGWLRQTAALLKKDLLLLRRSPKSLLLVILAPMLGVLMLIAVERFVQAGATDWNIGWNTVGGTPPIPLTSLSKCRSFADSGDGMNTYFELTQPCTTLVYAPNTSADVQATMQAVASSLGLAMDTDVKGFPTYTDILRYVYDNEGGLDLGVMFYNLQTSNFTRIFVGNDQFAPEVGAEILVNETSLEAMGAAGYDYFYGTFKSPGRLLTLQNAVSEAVISRKRFSMGKPTNFTMKTSVTNFAVVGPTSFGEFSDDFYKYGPTPASVESAVGGTLLIIGSFTLCLTVLAAIVAEKEKKMLGVLRLIGLHESAYWVSKQIALSPVAVVSSIIAEAIGRLAKVHLFVNSDIGIPAVVLAFFGFALVAQGCFLASFVSRSRWAAGIGFLSFASVVIFQSMFPLISTFTSVYGPTASGFGKFVMSSIPVFNFGKILDDMIQGTAVTQGMNATSSHYSWANFSHSPILGTAPDTWRTPSSADSLGFLFSNIFLFLLLAWYFSQVLSGDLSGAAQPPYFPFLPSYWGFKPKKRRYVEGDTLESEKQGSIKNESINVIKLSKSFKTSTALKEVSLTMENHKIFCMLGKNGAGKTTLVRTLSGLVGPTHGDAFVHGLSVTEDGSAIQSIIGMCSQDNLLWDDLTGRAHVELFCAFAGIPSAEIPSAVEESLKQVSLDGEPSTRISSSYSGGMKRRLCVALASVGAPKVIFLDEPTTGMDPLSRRRAWGMISRLRDRAIVCLTTHSMEEADALGDTVCILSEGHIRAIGSPLYLKNRYGAGYQLKLQCDTDENTTKLLEILRKHLPRAEVLSNAAGRLNVGVPKEMLKRVAPFFRAANEEALLSAWGFSLSTLEEVYLRLAPKAETNSELENLSNAERLCVMCAERPASNNVTLYTVTGVPVQVANHVCEPCSGVPPSVDESPYEFLDDGEATSFLQTHELKEKHDITKIETTPDLVIRDTFEDLDGAALAWQQTYAVFAKCASLQLKQKKYNICQLVTIVLLLVGIIVSAVIPVSTTPLKTCKGKTFQVFGPECVSFETFLLAYDIVSDSSTWYSQFNYVSGYTPDWLSYNFVATISQSNNNTGSSAVNVWAAGPTNSSDLPLLLVPPQNTYALIVNFNDSMEMDKRFFDLQTLASQGQDTFCPNQYYDTHGLAMLNATTNEARSYSQTHIPSVGVSLEKNDPQAAEASLLLLYPFKTLEYPFTGISSNSCAVFSLTLRNFNSADNNDLLAAHANVASGLMRQHGNSTFDLSLGRKDFPELKFPARAAAFSPSVFVSALMIPLLIMLPFPSLVIQVVVERQSGLVHLLKMGGLRMVWYWAGMYAWSTFLNLIFYGLIVVIGIALDIGYFQKFAGHFIALMFLWGHAQGALAIFLGSVCPSEKIAASVTYFVVFVIIITLYTLNLLLQFPTWPSLTGLIPPIGMVVCLQQIIANGSPVGLAENMAYQLLGGIFFMILGLYFHAVMPGSYANGQHPLFFLPSKKSSELASLKEDLLGDVDPENLDEDVKEERSNVQRTDPNSVAVSVRDVYKKFDGKPDPAVNHLYLQVNNNEIFGLLGPNGAGKTTLVSILCGVHSITSGKASVCGKDVGSNMTSVHREIGVCPQYEILWQDLTVEEHLNFFARIKGTPASHLAARVRKIAEKTQLDGDSFRSIASSLSGGQKRRLGLSLALAGEPSVLFLDEPTTGLDPESRHAVWKIIQSIKSERAVVLLTHSMEEADALCDRIGIMTLGQLRCIGNSLHLKGKYGSGYTLSFQLSSERRADVLLRAISEDICPGAIRIKDEGISQSYILPRSLGDIWAVFDRIELAKKSLGIREWALSQTTLEDVFVKVAEDAEIND